MDLSIEKCCLPEGRWFCGCPGFLEYSWNTENHQLGGSGLLFLWHSTRSQISYTAARDICGIVKVSSMYTSHISMRSMLIATVKLAGSDLSSCPTSPVLDDGMTILYCSAYGFLTPIFSRVVPPPNHNPICSAAVLPAARIGSTSPTLGRRLETNQSFTFGCGSDFLAALIAVVGNLSENGEMWHSNTIINMWQV